MTNILSVPHFQQSDDGYCLPACVRMTLAYLGIEKPEQEVSKLLGSQEFGTPSFAVLQLTKVGLQVAYRSWSTAELLASLSAGSPMIVFVRTGFLDYSQEDFAHALVVVGGEDEKNFWVQDPAHPSGPISVSWNGLLAAWAEFDYRGAILRV